MTWDERGRHARPGGRRQRSRHRAVLWSAVFTLCPSLLDEAEAGVIRVPGDYSTVAAALEAAVSGDSVLVSPGTYFEGLLTIESGVSLIGDGNREDIWLDVFEGMTLAPGPDPVRLENLSIEGDSQGRPDFIQAENVQCRIVNNLFTDEFVGGDMGTWLWGTGGGTIEGNWFESNRLNCILLTTGGPWTVIGNTIAPACVLNGVAPIQFGSFGAVESVTFRHNTVVGGSAAFDGAEIDVANNIFADLMNFYCDGDQRGAVHHNVLTISASDAFHCSSLLEGDGNLLKTDPEFCDPLSCDYRVSPTSPAIGAGENGETVGAWPVGCAVTGVSAAEAADSTPLTRPFPNPASERMQLRVGPSAVSVVVLDVAGRVVTPVHLEAGDHLVTWDGRDGRGRRVSPGVYFIRVEHRDQEATTHRIVLR